MIGGNADPPRIRLPTLTELGEWLIVDSDTAAAERAAVLPPDYPVGNFASTMTKVSCLTPSPEGERELTPPS